MTTFLAAYAVFYAAARVALLVLAVVAFVAFGLDWLVRTRRIGPFSPVARFTRRVIDPMVKPIEDRVLRAGGTPQSAPWWTLVAVVIGGIVLLSLLGFLRDQLLMAAVALQSGPGGFYVPGHHVDLRDPRDRADRARVISSWVGGSPYSPWWRWSFLLTEWLLAPLRRIVPNFGMIDVTPIIAYFLLRLLASLLVSAVR